MKSLKVVIVAILMVLVLCGCIANNHAVEDESEHAEVAVEVPEITLEPTTELLDDTASEETIEIEESNNTDAQEEVWEDQFPDGVDVEIQFIDDYTGFAIFTNNTGKDIMLETNVVCVDDYYDILGVFGTFGSYTKNGEKHIDVIETRDPIYAYQVDCSVGHIRNSVQEDNDAIAMTSSKNSDGSVTVQVTSSADYDIVFFVTIFYIDNEGNLIGYETGSPQFFYDMGGTFEAPGVDYDDYYIMLEVSTN